MTPNTYLNKIWRIMPKSVIKKAFDDKSGATFDYSELGYDHRDYIMSSSGIGAMKNQVLASLNQRTKCDGRDEAIKSVREVKFCKIQRGLKTEA